jgi:predicted secreted hydrolase
VDINIGYKIVRKATVRVNQKPFTLVIYFIFLLITLGSSQNNATEARTFEQALPGYHFSFPRDHSSHETYKTEWWYYTGHLVTASKKHYGFELTFFRIGQDQPDSKQNSAWRAQNIYSTHFAISDENAKQFHFYEKLNREGLNMASASENALYVENEGWLAEQIGEKMYIQADTQHFGIHLLLDPSKPLVVHGLDGVSQKASCKGCASHYYSMTRLKTEGFLIIDGKPITVSGLTWMDHEFGSNQLTEEQVGWDWFSIQLENNTEIMLYIMRNASGTQDLNSSGTIIYPDGKSEHLDLSQFKIEILDRWKSPLNGGNYPMGWRVSIPKLNANLLVKPTFQGQELVTKRSTGVSYWEGSCLITGKLGSRPIKGQSYVEMTGYAERFKKGI